MYAVIFEVTPTKEGKEEYLKIASQLKEHLKEQRGLISIERFQSLVDENKILSLSYWEDEASIALWRNSTLHREAQDIGNKKLFLDYSIKVAKVVRDYSKDNQAQTPEDSKEHKKRA